ncbi:MAG: autotransporter-associated beta strand repeat-containing protein [Pirellulales bacterium]|nr:autotransporter-associated beta strand repeat-containing protein [Pirellulales bacterium]
MKRRCSTGRLGILGLVAVAAAFGPGMVASVRAEDFDWRNVAGKSFVTPVKSQFGGTCWAFADTAHLESKYMITRNDPNFVPNLSEQQMVWEDNPDLGGTGGGGAFSLAYGYFASHGLVSEAECPANPGTDQPDADDPWPLAEGWEDRVWKATTYKCGFATSLQEMKDGLKMYGPMTVTMTADNDFYYPSGGLPRGGHAVLIVGFHDDVNVPGGGYWIIKNSWGTGWADGGYGKISYAARPRRPSDANALTGPVYYTGSMATATWTGGAGTWNAGGTRWTSEGSTYTWVNQETSAIFNGPGAAVTISGTVIAHGMTISTGATGYTFSGGTGLTLTAGGLTADESLTINTPLYVGAPQSWNVAADKTLTVGAVHTVISDLTVTGAGDTTINGAIDGGGYANIHGGAKAGGLVKAGSGTLTLASTMNYDGNVTVSAGTLKIQPASGSPVFSGAFFGSGTLVIDTPNAVTLGGGSSNFTGAIHRLTDAPLRFAPESGAKGTFSGPIDGSGPVLHVGPGTTVLTGANTYTGPTTITDGALQANIGAGIPSGSFLSLAGGVLQGNGTTTFSRNLGTSGNAFQWENANGGGFSSGGGTMTVLINSGAKPLAWGDTPGTHIIGPLKLSSQSAAGVTDFQNGLDLAGADRVIDVADNPNSTSDYARVSGVIAGAGAGIVKTGDGKLLLTGTNTYDGDTTIAGGALQVSSGAGLPSASYIKLAGGVLQGNSATIFNRALSATPGADRFCWTDGGGFSAGSGTMTVRINGGAESLDWGTTVGAEIVGTLKLSSLTATNVTTFDNGVNLNGAERTIHVDDNPSSSADYAVLSGAITGGEGSGLVKTGLGKLRLTGAGNTYEGTTTIMGGDVDLAKSSGYAIPGDLILAGGDTYLVRFVGADQMPSTAKWIWNHTPVSDTTQGIELYGHSQTVTGIWDTSRFGIIENAESDKTVAPCTLTVNNTEDCEFNGYMRNGTSSSVPKLSLVKSGTGTLTLSRDNIKYTGSTAVTGGKLVLKDAFAFRSSGVTNDGVFELQYYLDDETFTVPVTGSGEFVLAGTEDITLDGAISGTGSLSLKSDIAVVVHGNKTYTGGTTIHDGDLRLAATSGPAIKGDVTFIRPTSPDSTYRDLYLDGNNQLESTAKVHFSLNSRFILNAYSTTIGGLDYNVSSTSAATVRNGADTGPSTLTLNVGGAESYTFYGTLRDTSSGTSTDVNKQLALVKTGTGTQYIKGDYHSGQFSGGLTVQAGTLDYAQGVLPAGNLTINGGALNYGSQAKSIVAFRITGGSVNGTGTLTSSAAHDVRGGTVNAVLGGTKGLVKSGPSPAVLAGRNTYTGGTTIQDGDLHLASPTGPAVKGDVTFVYPATPESSYRILSLDADNQLETSAKIHFAVNSVLQLSTHSITIGGLDYNVPSSADAIVRNGGSTGKSTLTLNVPSGQSHTFHGALRDTTTGVSSDPNQQLALVKTGSGTQFIKGDYQSGQFSGGVTVNNGTLDLGEAALPVGDYTVAGGTLDIGTQTLLLSAGHQMVNNGTLAGGLWVYTEGMAQGTGRFGAVNVSAGGVFSPGNASAGYAATGPATWASGGEYLLEMSDADGAAGAGWDLWDVTGDLVIAPTSFTLAVTTLAGTTPGLMADFDNTQAYSWLIASATGAISGVENIVLDTSLFQNALAPAGQFFLSQTSDYWLHLNYSPRPSLPGDADGNGVVDKLDASALASHWLQRGGAIWSQGDFNGDGDVDDLDLAILAANWGATNAGAAAPEPHAIVLVLLGLATLLYRKHRRR